MERFLKAEASYTDPEGSGKSATSDATGEIVANNNEPMFSGTAAIRTLPENSGPGVNVVGGTITASDSDSGDTLSYSLSGTDSGSFEIDSNGQLKTKTGVTHYFNFEATRKSYSVTIEIKDSKDAAGNSNAATDDTIAVTINLTNVNEAPTITTTTTSETFAENQPVSTAVETFAALDVDASTILTWPVESALDGGKFNINSSTGALTFKSSPDFEMPVQSGGTDNEYR